MSKAYKVTERTVMFDKDNPKTVYSVSPVLTSTMRHPFHARVCANLDFLMFSSGLGCSGCRKAA